VENETIKILIIEDHIETAQLLEIILKRFDSKFDVEIEQDPQAGIERLLKNPFHALVLDYNLPGMNGLQVLDIIRESNLSLPVVMVTGQGDERIAVGAIKRGAYDYIVKEKGYMDQLPRILLRSIDENRLSSQLAESEKRYQALFENASDGIFIVDTNGFELLETNRMAEKLTGYSRQELLQLNFLDLCGPQFRKQASDILKQIIATGSANFDHLRILRQGNKLVPVDISASLVRGGQKPVIQMFVRDITDKKRLEQQILLSRRRLLSLFDGITDMISVLDHEYHILMANRKYVEACGTSSAKLARQKCFRAFFKRERPCVECRALDTYKSKKSLFMETFHNDHTFHIWTFPMLGLDGKPQFIVEYIKDVTEQKEIEKQLIKSEKMATLGLLSSGIAHELRNPLNIIETARYGVEEMESNLSPESLKKLEIIKRNVTRASGIINNLLQFSRHSEFEREKIDIANRIDTTIALLEKEMTSRHILLRTEYTKLPKVYFSIDSLKQVFLNIILNAIQAMPNGGTLKISAVVPKDQKWVIVNFSDTGHGIAKENLPHIFTPFYTTKKGKEGTGLGLYISYSIIQREGGDISVSSREGVGTTFTVKLPIANQTASNTV